MATALEISFGAISIKDDSRCSKNVKEAEEKSVEVIDYCIRSHKKFNSSKPLKITFSVNAIVAKCQLQVTRIYNSIIAGSQEKSIRELLKENTQKFEFDKTNDTVKLKCLTPFQGARTHRVFGSFRCFRCRNKWQSAASWTNKWQQCKKCEQRTYPFSQTILKKGDHDDDEFSKRPHDSRRCQKCIEQGELCLPKMYYPI